MRYTPYRGLAQVSNWVRLKFAAMNLKKLVLSSIFRKFVSEKMKYCAGKPGEGAAKPRLIAEEHMPTALSRVPRQRHSSE